MDKDEFHEFGEGEDALSKMFEVFRQQQDETGEFDIHRAMDAIALSLVHLGIDKDTYDITMPYRACMFALGYSAMGGAIDKVTLRIGHNSIGVAYAIDKNVYDSFDDVPNSVKEAMSNTITAVLQGMGATVTMDGGVLTIKGWDRRSPYQDHPAHGVGATMDIDKTVIEFRHELDEVLGDSEDPMSRWMRGPKKEDK